MDLCLVVEPIPPLGIVCCNISDTAIVGWFLQLEGYLKLMIVVAKLWRVHSEPLRVYSFNREAPMACGLLIYTVVNEGAAKSAILAFRRFSWSRYKPSHRAVGLSDRGFSVGTTSSLSNITESATGLTF